MRNKLKASGFILLRRFHPFFSFFHFFVSILIELFMAAFLSLLNEGVSFNSVHTQNVSEGNRIKIQLKVLGLH